MEFTSCLPMVDGSLRVLWLLPPLKLVACSCFEIDQEMDAILLIIGIAYRVCRIVIFEMVVYVK
jgi:hypothetical protein